MSYRLILRTFLFCTALSSECAAAMAGTCTNLPPVVEFTAHPFYSDAKGSTVDAERMKDLLQSLAPIRDFIGELIKRVDHGTSVSDAACAANMLAAWAEAKALAGNSSTNQEIYEKTRFLFALSVVAIKLRRRMALDSQVISWLRDAAQTNIREFNKRAPPTNNLWLWTGGMAAAAGRLSNDPYLRNYAEGVYYSGQKLISEDGTIEMEMKRGKRALGYNIHAANALLAIDIFQHQCVVVSCLPPLVRKIVDFNMDALNGRLGAVEQASGSKQESVSKEGRIIMCQIVSGSGRDIDASKACSGVPSSDINLGGDFLSLVENGPATRK